MTAVGHTSTKSGPRLPVSPRASGYLCCLTFPQRRYCRLGSGWWDPRTIASTARQRAGMETAVCRGSKDTEGGKAKATASEDALIAALAKMRPGVEFARARSRLAKNLGLRAVISTPRSAGFARTPRSRRCLVIGSPSRGRSRSTVTHCCATSSVAFNGTSSSATTALSRSDFGSC